ncbi:MAG: hypothetical protein JWQ90_3737 [Hydrocarboniphaga sp.]|nr:hypothetical protein [Hydrocarboniphaga sp.]
MNTVDVKACAFRSRLLSAESIGAAAAAVSASRVPNP